MRHEATLPWILLGLAVSVQCGGVETDMETDIRDRIVHHLGLHTRPDVQHANVSREEYERMMSVYQQSVSQTRALRQLRSD